MYSAGCNLFPRRYQPFLLSPCLRQVTQASKVWGEVPLPEDLEAEKDIQTSQSLLDDDEDFAADEASGGGFAKSWVTTRQQLLLIHASYALTINFKDCLLIPKQKMGKHLLRKAGFGLFKPGVLNSGSAGHFWPRPPYFRL